MQRPAPQLSRRTALGRLSALGCLAAAPALAQSDDELLGYAPRARPPEGYPAAYAVTVRAAEDEGQLSIHSTTDERVAMPLVADFRRLYPRIAVTYEDLGSTELYHRFIAENQLGRRPPTCSGARPWITWWRWPPPATPWHTPRPSRRTCRPGRSGRIACGPPPTSPWCSRTTSPRYPRATRRAATPRWRLAGPGAGRAVSYDIQKSGLGYFLAAQDAAASEGVFWATAQALGAGRARLLLTTDAMVRRIADGRARFGLNLLGAYTVAQARQRPTLGVIFPEDYTLVTSRVLLINNRTAHPNAARLWLDYLLSRRGQTVMATTARLYALREDVQGETTGAALRQLLGDRARPVALGPALSAPLANAAYGDFIARWRAALGYTKG